MCRRPRARAVLAVLVVLCAAGGLEPAAGMASVASLPVRVTAAFDPDAVLGAPTALDVRLRLNPRRLTRAPLTEVRFAYPRKLGLVSSGLGLATCTRPANDFATVLIVAPRLGGCPPNAVMGYGTALALVRLTNGQVIREYAVVTVLSGPIEHGRLGLVVYVDGQHPFGAKLAFQGEVGGASAPYGGALTVRMPIVPGLEELATISLVELRITIGSHAIRYYEHRRGQLVAYRPEGVELPARCPAHGFQFQAEVSFADGGRRSARSTTPCPPAVATPATRR
ncbi:MAG TPA: hypothetical protein VGO48_07040 [Conexibacter sp.]|nr:hypothetical protein [Conexibacter sp.]